jgi:hypothetical protein
MLLNRQIIYFRFIWVDYWRRKGRLLHVTESSIEIGVLGDDIYIILVRCSSCWWKHLLLLKLFWFSISLLHVRKWTVSKRTWVALMSLIVAAGREWFSNGLPGLALETTPNLELLMVRIGSAGSFTYRGLQFHHIKLQLLMNYNISFVCPTTSNIILIYTFKILLM